MEEDLNTYLFKYANQRGITCVWEPLNDHKPAYAVVNYNLIIVNQNWYKQTEIPFIIGHEISHVLNEDIVCNCQGRYAVYPYELKVDRNSTTLYVMSA